MVMCGVVALTVTVAGCQTTDPYTGEQKTSKTTVGAGTGALLGAGVGAIAGGSVGYYMDQQEKKLREQLAGTGVSVTRVGENLVLNMPGNITFQTGSADLNADFLKVLDSVGLVLKEYDKTLIVIAGHTDNVGTNENNQQLSLRRATSVGQYLAGRNVSAERMVINGYGESKPVASNADAGGRQQNRRVELTLEPIKEG
jgi:outer membrane protein OmpA-like peptidoglycan-associated protein